MKLRGRSGCYGEAARCRNSPATGGENFSYTQGEEEMLNWLNLQYTVLIQEWYFKEGDKKVFEEYSGTRAEVLEALNKAHPQETWQSNLPYGDGTEPISVVITATHEESGTKSREQLDSERSYKVGHALRKIQQYMKDARRSVESAVDQQIRERRLADGSVNKGKITADFWFKEYHVCESTPDNDRDMMYDGWKKGYYGYKFTRGANEVAHIHIRTNNWTGNVMRYIEISKVQDDGHWYAYESWVKTDMTEMIEYLLSEGWKPSFPYHLDYEPFKVAEIERLRTLLMTGDVKHVESVMCGGDGIRQKFVLKGLTDWGIYMVFKQDWSSPAGKYQIDITLHEKFETLDEMLQYLAKETFGYEAFSFNNWRNANTDNVVMSVGNFHPNPTTLENWFGNR